MDYLLVQPMTGDEGSVQETCLQRVLNDCTLELVQKSL